MTHQAIRRLGGDSNERRGTKDSSSPELHNSLLHRWEPLQLLQQRPEARYARYKARWEGSALDTFGRDRSSNAVDQLCHGGLRERGLVRRCAAGIGRVQSEEQFCVAIAFAPSFFLGVIPQNGGDKQLVGGLDVKEVCRRRVRKRHGLEGSLPSRKELKPEVTSSGGTPSLREAVAACFVTSTVTSTVEEDFCGKDENEFTNATRTRTGE
jgi:hypothetical protein